MKEHACPCLLRTHAHTPSGAEMAVSFLSPNALHPYTVFQAHTVSREEVVYKIVTIYSTCSFQIYRVGRLEGSSAE